MSLPDPNEYCPEYIDGIWISNDTSFGLDFVVDIKAENLYRPFPIHVDEAHKYLHVGYFLAYFLAWQRQGPWQVIRPDSYLDARGGSRARHDKPSNMATVPTPVIIPPARGLCGAENLRFLVSFLAYHDYIPQQVPEVPIDMASIIHEVPRCRKHEHLEVCSFEDIYRYHPGLHENYAF